MSVLQTVKLSSYCTLGNHWVVILQIGLSNSHIHRTHTVNREGALAHCSVQSCVSAPWWLEMIGSQTTHTAETPRYMVTSRPPGIKGTERRVFPPGGEDQQFFTLHRVLQTTCEWPGFIVLEVFRYCWASTHQHWRVQVIFKFLGSDCCICLKGIIFITFKHDESR